MIAICGFLLTIAILVVFHELGHYLVARAFGVKIITFSIGFGPKLISFKTKTNDWRISAIPLGGYVRMLDAREGDVLPQEKHLAYNYKKPWQKILIALAGPAFNFLFAFLAYYILAVVGVTELRPVISGINPELAQINQISIVPGSIITKINDIDVYSWRSADTVFNQQVNISPIVKIDLTSGVEKKQLTFNMQKQLEHFHDDLFLETLGLYPYNYLPVLGYIEPGSPAMKAGLRLNDKITSIDGQSVNNWFSIAQLIQGSAGKLLDMQILRNNKLVDIHITPDSSDNNGQVVGKIGIMPTLDQNLLQKNSFTHRYNMINAVPNAAQACYSIIMMNLSGLYHIASGQISLNNLGGPITIAKASSGALANGFKDFIDFLALISIGLGVMNLLPIPVLDGGHIFIYVIEWIIGKEITHQTQSFIFKIGFVVILSITILAVYNDILRL